MSQEAGSNEADNEYYRQLTMAAELSDLGQVERGLEMAYRLVRQYPEHEGRTHIVLAQILLAAGHKQEALAAAHRAVTHEPDDADAHYVYSRMLLVNGDSVTAEQASRAAIRIDSESADSFILLGACLSDQGKNDEAMQACGQALQLEPENADAHYVMGKLLAETNAVAAEWEFREAYRLDPGMHNSLIQLAVLYTDQKREQEAARAVAAAASIEPNNSIIRSLIDIMVARVVQAALNVTFLGLIALAILAAAQAGADNVQDNADGWAFVTVLAVATIAVAAVVRARPRRRALRQAFPDGGRLMVKSCFKRRRLLAWVVAVLAAVWVMLIAGTAWVASGQPNILGPMAGMGVHGGVAAYIMLNLQFRHEFD